MPLRMSVRPVASQTRAPPGNGIIARPGPAAPPSPSPDRERPRCGHGRRPPARSRSARRAPAPPRPPAGARRGRSPRPRSPASSPPAPPPPSPPPTPFARPKAGSGRRRPPPRRPAPDPGTEPLAPAEELARADAAPPGDAVHRLAGRQRLGHQTALVLLRPAPTRPTLEDLDPAHALAPRTSLTTRR